MLNRRLLPKLIVYLERYFNFAGEKKIILILIRKDSWNQVPFNRIMEHINALCTFNCSLHSTTFTMFKITFLLLYGYF